MSVNSQKIRNLVDEKRARLVTRKDSKNGYDKVLIRKWVKIDQRDIDDCIQYLRDYTSAKNKAESRTVKDPIASVHKREGTWYGGPVEERYDENGVKEVWQTLFLETATIGFFTVENNCAYKVERTLYLNSPSIPTTPEKDALNAITYRMSELFIDKDTGAFTGWVDKRTRLYQDTGLYTSETSEGRTVKRREQQGISEQAIIDGTVVLHDITQAIGFIKRQTKRKNNDCSFDSDTEIQESHELEGEIKRGTVLKTDVTLITRNDRDPSDYEAPEEGITRTHEKIKNLDGSSDTRQQDQESPVLSTERRRRTRLAESVQTGERNRRTENLVGPTSQNDLEEGQTAVYEKAQKEDGTHDESEEISTAPELSTERRRRTPIAESVQIGGRNRRTGSLVGPTEQTELEEGQTAVYEKTQNEDGTHNESEDVETAPVLPFERSSKTVAGAETVESGGRNLKTTDLQGPIEPKQGETTSYEKTTNRDDSKDERRSKVVSPVLEIYRKRISKKRTSERTGTQNKRDPKPEPTKTKDTLAIGQTLLFDRQKTPDGCHTYFEELSTIEDSNVGFSYELTSCRTLSTTEIEDNILQDLSEYDYEQHIPDTPGVRVVVRLIEDPETGAWNKQIVTYTAAKTTSTTIERQAGQTITTTQEFNAAEPVTIEDLDTDVGSISSSENPDCSHNNAIQSLSPTKRSVTITFKTRYGNGHVISFENWTKKEVDDQMATYKSYDNSSVSPSLSRFPGYVSGTIRFEPGDNTTSGTASPILMDKSYIRTIDGTPYTVRTVVLADWDQTAIDIAQTTNISPSDPLYLIGKTPGITQIFRNRYRVIAITKP